MIKKILKRVLAISLLLIVVGYGIFAMSHFSKKSAYAECKAVDVKLTDAGEEILISEDYIYNLVTKSEYNPIGKQSDAIDTKAIEAFIEKNKIVKNAEVYVTNSGKMKIKVSQRIPLYKIMNEGGNFFVDQDGVMMPAQSVFAAKLPIVSGHIEKDFAANELRNFVLYLQKNPFWEQQIEQICVHSNREVELIPKVGNHRILLGQLTDVDKKLNRLMKFYQKGLNEVGWNRYAILNLKYDKQIVCTKR